MFGLLRNILTKKYTNNFITGFTFGFGSGVYVQNNYAYFIKNIDHDNNGKIDVDEGINFVKNKIEKYDKNKDGVDSYELAIGILSDIKDNINR